MVKTSVDEPRSSAEEMSTQHTLAPHETAELEEEFEISGIPQPDGWETDPDNLHNWPSSKKWTMAGVVVLDTLVAPLASSMLAPGLPEMARHFDTSNPTLVSMILTR